MVRNDKNQSDFIGINEIAVINRILKCGKDVKIRKTQDGAVILEESAKVAHRVTSK